VANAVARAADGARAACTEEIGEAAALAAGLLDPERNEAESTVGKGRRRASEA
jgi:hypothetical protein